MHDLFPIRNVEAVRGIGVVGIFTGGEAGEAFFLHLEAKSPRRLPFRGARREHPPAGEILDLVNISAGLAVVKFKDRAKVGIGLEFKIAFPGLRLGECQV